MSQQVCQNLTDESILEVIRRKLGHLWIISADQLTAETRLVDDLYLTSLDQL